MATLQLTGRIERVYTFICSYIERTNTVPQLTDIMIGCALPRPLVELAIEHLQGAQYLHEESLLPTAHFPEVPF